MTTFSATDLLGVDAKLSRARFHGDEIKRRLADYIQANPVTLSREPHDEGRVRLVLTHDLVPLPIDVAVVLGDFIHNLHASLDYLAQLLVEHAGATPSTGTKFPIPKSIGPLGFDKRAENCAKGMAPEDLAAIKSTEPWRGGRGNWLWLLNELSNHDKHRLVLPVVAATTGMDLKFGEIALRLAGAGGPDYDLRKGSIVGITMAEPLATPAIGDLESRPIDLNPAIEIVLDASTEAAGIPVVRVVDELLAVVEATVSKFRTP